jgi:2-dehydro-3-deoxyglucarate aldolase
MVDSASQLLAVRDACRWPPAGTRGVGFSRANLFGKYFAEYAAEAQAPLLVAMIEHVRAVDELPQILAVEGLDAILIGPYDLSASIGQTGKFDSPEFIALMMAIKSAAYAARISCGIHVVEPSAEELRRRCAEGFGFLAYSLDSVFLTHGAMRPSL